MGRRWSCALLLGIVAVGAAGAVLAFAPDHQANRDRDAAPFAGVQWARLHYPGLNCGSAGMIAEQVEGMRVSRRSSPVALVMVGCGYNRLYANLYAFTPGPDRHQPRLLQRLALYQNRLQPISLASSANRVTLKVAGYTKDSGVSGPTLDTIRRWTWDGTRFRQLPTVPIRRIVMPNLMGMTYAEASRVLAGAGILSFQLHGKRSLPDDQMVVCDFRPAAGAVLHPPRLHVSVTIQS